MTAGPWPSAAVDELHRVGAPQAKPAVLGLDLSLTSTGWATPISTGRIQPKKLVGIERLRWITATVVDYCHIADASLIAIEGPAPHQSYGHVHERGGLWWMVVDALDAKGVPIAVVGPSTVKKYATGKGVAGKDEMLLATARRFDWFKGGNDEADALWLAAIAADLLGAPAVKMPEANRKDLASKVTWIREQAA